MRHLAQARNPYSRRWLWIPGSRFARPGMTTSILARSRQMPLHLRARFQCRPLSSDNLDDAFGREVHIDKAGRGIGDLVIFRDLAVAELHDRDALEHRARSLGLRQRRAIAEGVARIEGVAVADRRMHVPAEIGGGAIE